MRPYVITFASMPGLGKSAIASHLSIELKLPIFSNDAIRDEVHQDQDMNPELDVAEFEKRRAERFAKLLESKTSFIYDASVDRRWAEVEKQLDEAGYRSFVISFDLSKELCQKLYSASHNPENHFDGYFDDHQQFLQNFKDAVSLSITDSNFPQRLQTALSAVQEFIKA